MAGTRRIFYVEGYEMGWFVDGEHAVRWLEPWYVDEGHARFFEEDGAELRLTTTEGKVVVTEDTLGSHPEFLAGSFRYYLLQTWSARRQMSDDQLDGAGLGELVAEFCSAVKPR